MLPPFSKGDNRSLNPTFRESNMLPPAPKEIAGLPPEKQEFPLLRRKHQDPKPLLPLLRRRQQDSQPFSLAEAEGRRPHTIGKIPGTRKGDPTLKANKLAWDLENSRHPALKEDCHQGD